MYELALLKATWETVYMVFIASFISILLGLALGAVLFLTRKKQALENTWIESLLSFLINVTRSIPFIILMISIIPLTRLLMGTTIGTNAAIVPLTLAAIPFFARVCESALQEVSGGLIEAGNAMGATTWQIVKKFLLPESLPALIRGATLTVIALIGYSAMAGVVGGGGLGELAINYGYQRFNLVVMIETVIILIVMVQVIQVLGDYLAKKRKLKPIVIGSIILWFGCIGYHCWPSSYQEKNTLKVGVMAGSSQQIMAVAAREAEKQGLKLEVITFTDYVQPNTALSNSSIDANIFQHAPYLEGQVKSNHFALKSIAKTFVYPMGFYSEKIKTISDLKEGALIAIPNDPSNGARALLLLEKVGLIKLKPAIGTNATINDVIENNHHLQFKLLDAAQSPRALKDVDLVAITNDFVGPAGLTINQAVLKEESDSPYANLIVVRAKDDNPLFQKLIAIMHSEAVLQETQKVFPNGAAIPAW